MNKNKKKENKVESLGNINRNYQDINDKSIKYNSRSINNNYNESDNNSMIQQMSQGSDGREKLDMFD